MLAVCGVQMAPRRGDSEANVRITRTAIEAATREGARLVVFPEASLTGYVFHDRASARDAAIVADGRQLAEVADSCRATDAWTVVGAIERDGELLHNSLFLVGPDGVAGHYRKLHTLCLGVDRFTTPGSRPPPVFETPLGRIGLNICYDGSFPETGRALKLAGAQLIVLPTNWPNLRLKREQVQIRAYENHVNYLAVNRVGEEEGVAFHGGSMAADPSGEIIAEIGDGPGFLHVEFDMEEADSTRVVEVDGEYEYDYVADRRPDMYGRLTEAPPAGEPSGSRRA
ncbi:MAG: carbon-nitrogen hydrolase family protein [Gemmatimonadetes bacterium]|nr:carbon-nitrogen hydrolase family protein [Gemmatimonadota bacterium]